MLENSRDFGSLPFLIDGYKVEGSRFNFELKGVQWDDDTFRTEEGGSAVSGK